MHKNIGDETNQLVRQLKKDQWETFSKQLENYFYGLQIPIWHIMRHQRREIKELMRVSKIEHETWIKYLRDLHKNEESNPAKKPSNIKINNDIENLTM